MPDLPCAAEKISEWALSCNFKDAIALSGIHAVFEHDLRQANADVFQDFSHVRFARPALTRAAAAALFGAITISGIVFAIAGAW